MLAVVAGVGWLYLLRDVRALAAGPALGGALPLQQLAGGAAQPLLRLVAAWLPAGLAAGAVLRLAASGRATRIVGLAVLGAVILVATGAVSDAVAVNEPVARHLGAQLGHAGIWAAVVLLVAGAVPLVLMPSRRRRPRRGARAVASGR